MAKLLLILNVKMPPRYSWSEHALGQGPANWVIESLSHRVEKTFRTLFQNKRAPYLKMTPHFVFDGLREAALPAHNSTISWIARARIIARSRIKICLSWSQCWVCKCLKINSEDRLRSDWLLQTIRLYFDTLLGKVVCACQISGVRHTFNHEVGFKF